MAGDDERETQQTPRCRTRKSDRSDRSRRDADHDQRNKTEQTKADAQRKAESVKAEERRLAEVRRREEQKRAEKRRDALRREFSSVRKIRKRLQKRSVLGSRPRQ